MKKMVLLLTAAIMVALLITGCTSPAEEAADSPPPAPEGTPEAEADNSLVRITAAISTEPEVLSTGTSSRLEVQIRQGDELVDDADEVIFEFWKYGEEEHQIMDGAFQGEGTYSIEYTFVEDGIYYLVPHITARNMHIMPSERFTVGDISEEEIRKHEAELEELQNSQYMNE